MKKGFQSSLGLSFLFLISCSRHKHIIEPLPQETPVNVKEISKTLISQPHKLSQQEHDHSNVHVVIRVNDAVITNADIDIRCKMMSEFMHRKDPGFLKLIRPQVQQRLIDEALYEQIAQKFKIDLSKDMLKDNFERQAKRFGLPSAQDFEKQLRQLNLFATFMASLKGQLMAYYLSVVAMPKDLLRVSETAIDQTLKEETENAQKVRYSVYELVFYKGDHKHSPKETAEHTYEELKKIKQQIPLIRAFPVLSQQVSQGASSKQGGLLGWLTLDQMPPQMKTALQSLSVGDFSKPVCMKNGMYKIFFLGDIQHPGKGKQSATRLKIKVISIPFQPNLPQDKINQINRRVGTLLSSKNLQEFENIAQDFHYPVRVTDKPIGELPDVLHNAPLNQCAKPIFTGDTLEICWIIKKVEAPSQSYRPSRQEIQQMLEQDKRTAYAEKFFKDFKNRALIQGES